MIIIAVVKMKQFKTMTCNWYGCALLQAKSPIPMNKQAMQGMMWPHASDGLQGGTYSLKGEIGAGWTECKRVLKWLIRTEIRARFG